MDACPNPAFVYDTEILESEFLEEVCSYVEPNRILPAAVRVPYWAKGSVGWIIIVGGLFPALIAMKKEATNPEAAAKPATPVSQDKMKVTESGSSRQTLPQVTSLNRNIVHPTRYWETLVHLLKGNIGAGSFAMGDAYKNAGLLGGLFGTVFVGLVCIYCSHILIWSSARIREKCKMDSDPSFEETVEYCFEYGPRCYRKCAKVAGVLVKVFIVVTQLGFCCVFFVFVSTSFDNVLRQNEIFLPKITYVMIMYAILLAICLIGHLKFLTPVSLAGTLFVLIGVITIVVLSAVDLPNISTLHLVAGPTKWPLFFGTVVYAFEGIALVIPLRAEMRQPKNFGSTFGVYNVGMLIVMTAFNLVGFIGYWKYGEEVQGSVSFNLTPSILTWTIQVLVALGILFSYPLQFFVASTVVYEAVIHKYKDNMSNKKKQTCAMFVRGILVSITCLIAIFVPNLGLFISLIGAVSSTALALVFPVLCHISLFTCPEEYEPAKSKLFPYLIVIDAISLLLGFLGFLTGAYFSIHDIVRKFDAVHFGEFFHVRYGAPRAMSET